MSLVEGPVSFASVDFQVRGIPVPQGSVKAFMAGGRARVATKSAPLMAWRTAIAAAASGAMGAQAVADVPLAVTARFYLPRPKSAPRRVMVPATKPDVDKLLRALLDGMTGVVFRDDSLVVRVEVAKEFDTANDGRPGVWVDVRPWSAA